MSKGEVQTGVGEMGAHNIPSSGLSVPPASDSPNVHCWQPSLTVPLGPATSICAGRPSVQCPPPQSILNVRLSLGHLDISQAGARVLP